MNTLKNSLAGLAFVFALVAAFAFTSPVTTSSYASIANDEEGTNCQPQTGVVASNCLITNLGPQCQNIAGKFVFQQTGCVAPLKRPQ